MKPNKDLIESAEIFQKQDNDNQLLKSAFYFENEFRKQSFKEIKYLLLKIQEYVAKCAGKENFETFCDLLKSKIVKKMENDITLAKKFNEEIKQFNTLPRRIANRACNRLTRWTSSVFGCECSPPTVALKTNKLELILKLSQTFITNLLSEILQGKPIFGYNYEYKPNKLPLDDNKSEDIYGSAKITILKASLIYCLMILTKKSIDQLPLHGEESPFGIPWYVNSASAYYSPLPSKFKVNDFKDYSLLVNSGYKRNNEIKYAHLVIIYNGYGFGGPRDLPKLIQNSYYKPQDCSYWIGDLTQSLTQSFGTKDFLYLFNEKIENKTSPVPKLWAVSNTAVELRKHFEPVIRKKNKWQRGSVFVYRNENDGHMGIVLGLHKATLFGLTISRNSNMDGVDGISIQKIPAKSMNFRWKK